MLFFKQKTAYELRISDWSSDVCSSDLTLSFAWPGVACPGPRAEGPDGAAPLFALGYGLSYAKPGEVAQLPVDAAESRSEEHTSELQSLMRISYAVFCLKKKN